MARKSNTTLVREYIRDCIIHQRLQPGDMLPAEGEIAAALEISKSSVREATRALEGLGLIEIKHGIGLVLRSFNLDAFVDIFGYGMILDPNIVLDIYDLRKLIETALMKRVIASADEAVLTQCDEVIAQWGELVKNHMPAYEIDCKFHETLYAPIGNKTLSSLCTIFWTSFKGMEAHALIRRTNPQNEAESQKVLDDHKKILSAVRQKDVPLASKLMEEHFGKLEM